MAEKAEQFIGDTVEVAIDSDDACPYVRHQRLLCGLSFEKTPFPKAPHSRGRINPGGYGWDLWYSQFVGCLWGIGKYWGWPVERFEIEIEGFMQQPSAQSHACHE